jgi:hypothetical protein
MAGSFAELQRFSALPPKPVPLFRKDGGIFCLFLDLDWKTGRSLPSDEEHDPTEDDD